MAKRNIMEKFKLSAIAAVDKPCQEGARAVIMKRAEGGEAYNGLYLAKRDGESDLPLLVETYLKRDFSDDRRKELASSGAALPDGSFPIENRGDLRNAVRALGRAKNRARAKAHIVSRARALGATSSLPDTWKSSNFRLLKHLTNDEVMQGFDKAVSALKAEQQAADFNGEQANAECREYANGLLEELGEAVCSLRTVYDEILDDDAIKNKDEALQESFEQFMAHIKGIIPEGIENGLAGAALHEAGFKVNERGALTKRETDMGFDIRKSLGLPATATDAEVEKAFGDKIAAFGKADTTNKTLANILKMSAVHTNYMGHKNATMPEGGKEAFANMTAEERDAHIKANPLRESKAEKAARLKAEKAARKNAGMDDEDEEDEDDPDCEKRFTTVDGTIIKRDDVGANLFAVMKSQDAQLRKFAEERATAVFTKRAETAMSYIGKGDEIGGLLQSIAKLDGGDKVAEAVAKKFEQLNEMIKKGGSTLFNEIGKSNSGGGSFSKAKDQIEAQAAQLVKDGKAKTMFKARDMVRQGNPDLRKQEEDERAEEQEANKRRNAA